MKIVGLLDREKKKRGRGHYLRRCKVCIEIYRTSSKYSQVCPTCRCTNTKLQKCKICGEYKQFGNKMNVCIDCRNKKFNDFSPSSRRKFSKKTDKNKDFESVIL